MSRVIKNNDGVAIVEGTPASSLVKDVDKFFAAKPPERMAGESIVPFRRDTMLTGKMKDKDGNEIIGRKPTREEFDSYLAEQGIFRLREEPLKPEVGPEPTPTPRPEVGLEPEPLEITARRKQMIEDRKARPKVKNSAARANEQREKIRRDLRDTMSREGERPFYLDNKLPRRNEAKDRAESRRKRFFERRRSRKEAERSQREQEATQGKFITTLGE